MTLPTLTKPIFWIPWFGIVIMSYFFVDLPLTIYVHQIAQPSMVSYYFLTDHPARK